MCSVLDTFSQVTALITVLEYVKNCLTSELLFLKIERAACRKTLLKSFTSKVKFRFISYIPNMLVMPRPRTVVVTVTCADETVVSNLAYNHLHKTVKTCVMSHGALLFPIYLVVSYELRNWGETISHRCHWLWNSYWPAREVIVIMLMSYAL